MTLRNTFSSQKDIYCFTFHKIEGHNGFLNWGVIKNSSNVTPCDPGPLTQKVLKELSGTPGTEFLP